MTAPETAENLLRPPKRPPPPPRPHLLSPPPLVAPSSRRPRLQTPAPKTARSPSPAPLTPMAARLFAHRPRCCCEPCSAAAPQRPSPKSRPPAQPFAPRQSPSAHESGWGSRPSRSDCAQQRMAQPLMAQQIANSLRAEAASHGRGDRGDQGRSTPERQRGGPKIRFY